MMEMEYTSQKSVRFYPDQTNFRPPYDNESSRGSRFSSFNIASPFIKPGGLDNLSGSSSNGGGSGGGSGKSESFVAGKGSWRKKIFDPGSEHIQSWNRIFLISCLVALFLDPLYFYFPYEGQSSEGQATCLGTDKKLGIAVTIFRTFADVFYFIHMLFKFRTAYIAPSSRVFGRGELVMDPKKIAIRYLKSDFAIDFIASLPLPQVVIWVILPAVRNSSTAHKNVALALIVLFQYIPRLYLIFPLSAEMVRATGVVTKTAWAGAAYNLLLYMIASHVLGAAWYLISIERHTTCWRGECSNDKTCTRYLDCSTLMDADRIAWANSTQVFGNCDPNNSTITFKYGIFLNALTNNIGSSNFINKYLYCLWWGLQQLSSYGQNLQASTFIGETAFCILIAIMGLVLFAHLIGNMQTYLQSLTVRLEEWRLKKRDTEEWMKHRQLPPELQERVRRFVQYKWVATRGVNEGSILSGLPTDLHREIRRHLSLDLVRRVHFFSQMDDQLLDAICERLVSSLSTEATYIVREGDPVTEMLFIIRGRLDSSTTNGGRTGFFDSTTLKPGDFCGEELLEWALLPKKAQNLPSSTRTVRALTEVEGFALPAEGLKFVANQFRRLHSKKLQHTLHFYSHHWRTWAARFIQAAWRRFKQRKMAMELSMRESFSLDEHNDGYDSYVAMEQSGMPSENSSSSKQNLALLASRFAGSTKKGTKKGKVGDLPTEDMPMPKKPNEPDYSNDGEEEQP